MAGAVGKEEPGSPGTAGNNRSRLLLIVYERTITTQYQNGFLMVFMMFFLVGDLNCQNGSFFIGEIIMIYYWVMTHAM